MHDDCADGRRGVVMALVIGRAPDIGGPALAARVSEAHPGDAVGGLDGSRVRFAYPGYRSEAVVGRQVQRNPVIPAKAGTQAVMSSGMSRHSSGSWNPSGLQRL